MVGFRGRDAVVKDMRDQFLINHPIDVISKTIGPREAFYSGNLLMKRFDREGQGGETMD